MNARTWLSVAAVAIVLAASSDSAPGDAKDEPIAGARTPQDEPNDATLQGKAESTRESDPYLTVSELRPTSARERGFQQAQLPVIGGRPAKVDEFPFAPPLLSDLGGGESVGLALLDHPDEDHIGRLRVHRCLV